MGEELIRAEVNRQVACVTLCSPPVNALSRGWADQFAAVLDSLQSREDWRVLIVRSDQKVFSAGGDLKQYAGRLSEPGAGELLASEAAYYQQLFRRIQDLPQVSIAEIAGVAAGGGLELALACDLRVASTETRLGQPEVTVGLLAAGGGTQRVTRLCGRGAAMRLLGLGDLVSGSEALRLGLVEWAVPPEEIASFTADLARRLASMPREALQAAKACVAAAASASESGFELELTFPPKLMQTAETLDRIKAFFARLK